MPAASSAKAGKGARIAGTVFLAIAFWGTCLVISDNPVLPAVVEYSAVFLFAFAVPWFFTVNPFGALDRAFASESRKRIVRVVAFACCLAVLLLLCWLYGVLDLPWTQAEYTQSAVTVPVT